MELEEERESRECVVQSEDKPTLEADTPFLSLHCEPDAVHPQGIADTMEYSAPKYIDILEHEAPMHFHCKKDAGSLLCFHVILTVAEVWCQGKRVGLQHRSRQETRDSKSGMKVQSGYFPRTRSGHKNPGRFALVVSILLCVICRNCAELLSKFCVDKTEVRGKRLLAPPFINVLHSLRSHPSRGRELKRRTCGACRHAAPGRTPHGGVN